MDEVLEKFRSFLDDKGIKLTGKSLTSLLVLLAVLILLPLSLLLVMQRTNFLPKAQDKWIQLNNTGCVKVVKDKKLADCPLIPLKLINPFFGISSTNSTAPSASAPNNNSPQPSVSPDPSSSSGGGSPQNVNVKSFGNNIQQAMDSIKTSGGSVYLPEGTYEIGQKVRLYSNTTLFGDGIGKTVIKFSQDAFVDDMMANDSSSGQQNITIRDLTLQGPDIARTGNCCHGLKLENLNGGYVINVEVNDVGMDGIHLGYKIKNGTAQGVSNVRVTGCKVGRSQRQQVGYTSGSNVVIDNCTIDGTNKFGASVYVGIDLEPDLSTTVTNSYVLNNNVSNSNIGIALNGANGESGNADSVRDNKVCANNASGAITAISDSGTNNTVTSDSCDMPGNLSNLPAAPAKPTADNSLYEKIINWFTPKSVFAAPGYSGVQVNGCGEITSAPAVGASEGDFTFKAPVRVGNEWQTKQQDGGVVTQQQMKEKAEGDPRVGDEVFFGFNYINCSIFIDYSENGDCDVDSPPKGREGINGGKLVPGESVTFHVRLDSTPQSPGCRIQMQTEVLASGSPAASASVAGSPTIAPTGNPNTTSIVYRLAESQDGLNQAQWKVFAFVKGTDNIASSLQFPPPALAQDSNDVFTDAENPENDDVFVTGSASPGNLAKQSIDITFRLTNTNPGFKQIWVQYLHPDGTTVVDNVQFELVPQSPQIVGLACNLDVSKQNLNITIEGARFTDTIGSVESVSPAAKPEVTGWNDKQITAVLKKPSISIAEGQKFKIKVVRADGAESGTAVCAVDKSLVSLGARIFCREPGKFDASNVSVYLVYNPQDNTNPDKLNKIEEKVTIDPDGQIANLKTQLQVGRNYAIAIKAPSSLRRTSVFTAQEGTTEILKPDGSPFILPIGDIAPVISVDGRINTLDRAELIRQWRIFGTGETKLTGDFNRDGRVNSIDWACMNYDFGSEDDPLPVSIPQPASGTINTGGSSGTITIPVRSAAPSPSI